MNRLLVLGVAFGIVLLQACTTSEALREGSRPMTAAEVQELYAGKTWNWEVGGVFFAPSREFRAWSRNEAGRPGYATGEWRTTDAGLLCFAGPWRFAGERTFSESCFRHRIRDGRIYQRAEPTGSWFLFRSDPPHQDDAWLALVPGDHAGRTVDFIKTACGSPFQRCRLPEESRAFDNAVPAVELEQLYAGRTWLWTGGAGYFGPSGWFAGWATDQSGQAGYTVGSWSAGNSGLLCITGPWVFDSETTTSERCFAHRREGGTIYQRVEPLGNWYVFRSSEPGVAGEYDSFVAGNLVAPKLAEIRDR